MTEKLRRRKLTERLGLAPDALPGAGAWYPDDKVLELLLDLVAEHRPADAVVCGASVAVVVLALAAEQAGEGRVTVLENDPQVIEITEAKLEELGVRERVRMVEAELTDWDRHTLWYNRWALAHLPEKVDLLFIDGPPHFAGRSPRLPAGPELFPRLAEGAVVVLDDAKRAKEKKALNAWAKDFPGLIRQNGPAGSAILRGA